MSTARVWAPTRPTVDPDRVVLALLETGDDPEKDLGAALLAVHRAGAAACQLVAAAPVPDEVALIRTLAECRGRVAPAVAECVSKSVDDPQYAHLLTRDVFDDAEQAALTLFRACVAKGVSPPLACQRVGHVFGVPREHLGRYFTLATNPATGAVALVDAADRALLAHVAKVARSETEDTLVTISKAPEPERAPRNPEFEASVRRDSEGRFAEEEDQPPDRLTRIRQRLGLSGAAPRVAGAPPVRPEPGRKHRKQRKQRVVRTPAPTADIQLTPQLRTGQLVPRATLKLKSPDLAIQARTELQLRQLPMPEPEPDRTVVTDVMKTRDDPNAGSYHSLSEPLAVTVPASTGVYLRGQMIGQGDSGEPWVMRLGHLLDVAGEMESADSPEAVHLREAAADQVWGTQDAEHEPVVHRIKRTEENYYDSEFVEHMRGELATDIIHTDQGPLRRVNLERKKRIVEFQDPDPDSSDILLVEFKSATEGGPVQNVIVDEFVIGDGAVGRTEGTGKHVQYVLDPNKTYSLPGGRRPQRYFDEESKAIVNRWWLVPIPEAEAQRIASAHRLRRGKGPIGKAAPEPERVRNPAFEATVNRDEEGQFAVEEKRTVPPARKQRKQRKQRKVRTQRLAQAPLVTRSLMINPQLQMKTAPLAPKMQTKLQAGLTAHLAARPAPNLPELHDKRYYHVLSHDEMNKIWQDAHVTADERVWHLGREAKEQLYNMTPHNGLEAAGELRANVDAMVTEKEGDSRSQELFKHRVEYEDDEFRLGEKISAYFDKDPKLAQVTIDDPDEDGYVQVWGNEHAIQRQFLIEIEDGTNFDDLEIEMVFLGDANSKDMLLHARDVYPLIAMNENERKPFNAKLQRFRVHNVPVGRYRAGRAR